MKKYLLLVLSFVGLASCETCQGTIKEPTMGLSIQGYPVAWCRGYDKNGKPQKTISGGDIPLNLDSDEVYYHVVGNNNGITYSDTLHFSYHRKFFIQDDGCGGRFLLTEFKIIKTSFKQVEFEYLPASHGFYNTYNESYRAYIIP